MAANPLARAAVIAASLAMNAAASAGVPSLIAGLHAGDELRYAYTLTTEEVTSITGKTGPESLPTRVVSNQTVFLTCKVTAETTASDIMEVTFDNVAVSMQAGDVSVGVDAGSPTIPDEKANPGSHDLYAWFHPLVSAKLTLNIAPGSGEITSITGGEDLLKGVGGPHLARYVDPDLFRANFGCIFQLKSNSQMPPPGQKWYTKTTVYARGVKAPVWETRWVEGEEGGIADIRSLVKASAKPEDSTKVSVFFRSVDSSGDRWWDTTKGRLTKAVISQTIQTRFQIGEPGAGGVGVLQDSDLSCRSALEIIETPPAKPAGGAAQRPPPPPAPEPKKTP
ncbi:MAG TPA: hypothetical protein VHC70_08485 [Phycisphaerales bacterium]|nr:hypothetical protein [Phycisphaerales bacterium]